MTKKLNTKSEVDQLENVEEVKSIGMEVKIEETSLKSDEKVFAEKWGFPRIFMFFIIGCIIGTYYEQLLYLVRSGLWESRRGVIYGPFNPVYGLGFMAFALFLGKNNDTRPWYLTFLYTSLLGGIAEYLTSYIGEVLFNAQSWDYSEHFLNINGRTTIPYMIFWGLGGLVFMKFAYPFMSKMISRIPYNIGRALLPILVVFMILNMFISYSALIRQANRLRNLSPANAFSEFLDKYYTDDFLKKYYSNMIHYE